MTFILIKLYLFVDSKNNNALQDAPSKNAALEQYY